MKKILFLLLFIAPSSYAADSPKMPNYIQAHKIYIPLNCINSQTQAEMDECHHKNLPALTTKMDMTLSLLKKNYKTSEPGLLKELEKSQAAWKNYYVANCDFETYESRNGTGYYSILNMCLETKINERISYLQWMLDHP